MSAPTWSERGLAAIEAAQAALANPDGSIPSAAMPRWGVLQYRRNVFAIRVDRQRPPRYDGGRKPGNPPHVRKTDHKRGWRDSHEPAWFGGAS